MLQQTNLEKQAAELYTLLGHQVERVIKHGDYTSDLVIKTQNREKWVTRCEERDEVNNSAVRDFFQVLQVEKAKQAAIITTGAFAPEVRQLVRGKPVHLIDGNEFQAYLSRARALAQAHTHVSSPTKKDQVESLSANQIQSTGLKKCPYCAEMIQDAAIVCRFCGHSLTETLTLPSETVKLPKPLLSESEPTKQSKSGIRLYQIAALLLFVSVLSGVFVVAQYGRQVTRTAIELQELKATEQYLRVNTLDYDTYSAGVQAAAEAKGYTITKDGSLVRVTPLSDYLWVLLPVVLFAAAVITAVVGIIKRRRWPKEDSITEQPQQSLKTKSANAISLIITVITIITVVVGATGGWYYFYGPCGTLRVQNASDEIGDLMGRWLAADSIASSTPRIALSGQISNLQSLRDEAGDLKVPLCLDEAKAELLAGMDNAIKGYISFMAQESDVVVSGYFGGAKTRIANFTDLLLKIKSCAPFCK